MKFDWICLFFEHRQLTHTYHKYKYGTYFTKTGMRRRSVPPSFITQHNKGKDNTSVGLGYVDAVAIHLNRFIDSVYKNLTRDLILAKKKQYSKSERTSIMNYCDDDVKYLSPLLRSMTEALYSVIGGSYENILVSIYLVNLFFVFSL